MTEQRRSKRFQLHLPVELVKAGGARVSHVGETRNMSSVGILFTLGEARLEVGQSIEYLIHLPGTDGAEDVRLRCLGKVVRQGPEEGATAATLERYEFVRY